MTARHGDLTLCLTGDVMTGRGVDQLLPHPGDPQLREGYVTDAGTYLALAGDHAATLNQLSRPYGGRVLVDGDGTLRAEPDHG